MYLPLNKQFKMENTIKETEEESNKNVGTRNVKLKRLRHYDYTIV